VGDQTTLNDLYALIRDGLSVDVPALKNKQPIYRDFRAGDVRHSLADIGKASRLLGYIPSHRLAEGLSEALVWYSAPRSGGNVTGQVA
jgi:Nucleoside-diphosphate-sugar epimerases